VPTLNEAHLGLPTPEAFAKVVAAAVPKHRRLDVDRKCGDPAGSRRRRTRCRGGPKPPDVRQAMCQALGYTLMTTTSERVATRAGRTVFGVQTGNDPSPPQVEDRRRSSCTRISRSGATLLVPRGIPTMARSSRSAASYVATDLRLMP
jgi:hypothetical protein